MKGFIVSIDADTFGPRIAALVPMIKEACERAVKVSASKLGDMNYGQPISIIFEDEPEAAIKEDGVGGSTRNSGLIIVSIDPSTVTPNGIYTTVCHELVHAKRFSVLSEMDNRPIAAFIAEGLAVAFESEIRDDNAPETFFLHDIENRHDGDTLIDKVKASFNDENYDWDKNYGPLFFDGDAARGLPQWAGYEIGYALVHKYMVKTGKKASELVNEKPDAFIP